MIGTGATLVAGAFERVAADAPSSMPDIRALLQASGFNPDNPDSALMAVIADVHISTEPANANYNMAIDDALVAEINGLSPAITDLAVAGDLVISHSRAIGEPRYPSSYAFAQQELALAKQQLTRFRSGMRLWSVPGNHDSDREETDAELWRAIIGTPPYQKAVLGGVPVFFLNSGHGGMMDPVQVQWFNQQAALIPTGQEVLVICHYPSFAIFATSAGLKRTVATALAGHQAAVWIVSGHNHNFREDYYHDKGTRFIQGQVTATSTHIFSDGKSPGYTLLGLQDGRVACRMFRSTKVGDFQVLPPLSALSFTQMRWAFDRIEYPGEVFHEGFYDRTGRILSFQAVDVKCHFMHVQNMTWQVNLGRFGGKIREFLLSGGIGPPTRVFFSATSPNGPWVEVALPPAAESAADRVYRFLIPEPFLSATTLYANVASDLPWGLAMTEIAGWGVAATAQTLTGYEKWISRRYGSFLHNDKTAPLAIPAGSAVPNLMLFAFNLAPATPTVPALQGLPSYSIIPGEPSNDFAFARRKAGNHPGISYIAEESADLASWTPLNPARLTVTSLDGTWEEVRLTEAVSNGFFRVRLENTSEPQGSFQTWQNSVAVPAGPPGDSNANSINDLIEYGFNLTPDGANLPYDPGRTGNPAGLPTVHTLGPARSRIVFPRMRADAAPGVVYTLEQSPDLANWSAVPAADLTERILQTDGTWEQVECLAGEMTQPGMFYRVRVELSQSLLL